MNITLIGYGKMGKEIEKIAIDKGHSINLIIDHHNFCELNSETTKFTDVVIEFTQPNVVINNIEKCFELNLPVVTGTTGWYNQIDAIKDKCENSNQAFLYATNFSIGVNMFFKATEFLTSMISSNEGYLPSISEIHHTQKLDKPSGTAITLADIIIEKYPNLSKWSLEHNTKDSLFIDSLREEGVVGTHAVNFKSDIDEIEIIHRAHNRSGFAIGAVLAAEWLYNKKGFFAFNKIFEQLI